MSLRRTFATAAIFVTGGVILGLEVLSSRILTPYFGVSLYIWAAILSVTLVCLAVGYGLGSRLSLAPERLEERFALLLSLAALAVPLAALLYPLLFPHLARGDLVAGSFLGCLVLLALPLVALSALNPLLIAIRNDGGGDAGAGRVLAISTFGSVAGVLVTAFLLIPYASNRMGLLLMGAVLTVLAAAALVIAAAGRRGAPAALFATAAAVLGLVLIVQQGARAERIATIRDQTWRVLDERHSLFGTIQVIEVTKADERRRIYYQEGVFQGETDEAGVSVATFDWMLTKLPLAVRPQAKTALVLGMGAGLVPMRLARAGLRVETVDINPHAPELAQKWFGFDPELVTTHIADARAFVAACRDRFDIIVIDLFHGDGVPTHLLTREFYDAVGRCGHPGALVMVNSFRDGSDESTLRGLLATIGSEFSRQALLTVDAQLANAFILASNGPLPTVLSAPLDDIPHLNVRRSMERYFANGRRITPERWRGFRPVGDEDNIFPVLYARSSLRFRQAAVAQTPPDILW